MPLLIDAIRKCRCSKVQLALQLGWDLNERDDEQLRTPLIELSFVEREAVSARLCKRLLLAGARPDLKDVSGRNALHWACAKGREKLVEIFLNNWEEYDINAQDCQGNTALCLAVISSNENIVRKLITILTRYKLSVDVSNNNGETPLILASKSRSYFLCELLTKVGRASTEMRDRKKYLNAKEWESYFTEPFERDISARTRNNMKNINLDTPELLLERSFKRPHSIKSNYKNGIRHVFNLYYDELSTSFRQPVIPPPKEEESDLSDLPTCYENVDDYPEFSVGDLATCPVTPSRGKKRFSISKAAQVPITVNRMRKTKNAETSKTQNSWTSRQEHGKLNSRRSIIPKLEVNTIVPVVKRNTCPVLRHRRTINSRDELAKFTLESLPEDIEQK
jgi:hypothetical protein